MIDRHLNLQYCQTLYLLQHDPSAQPRPSLKTLPEARCYGQRHRHIMNTKNKNTYSHWLCCIAALFVNRLHVHACLSTCAAVCECASARVYICLPLFVPVSPAARRDRWVIGVIGSPPCHRVPVFVDRPCFNLAFVSNLR